MKQLVLVINCGSSSIKFAVINANSGDAILSGLAEGLGGESPCLSIKDQGEKNQLELTDNTHQTAMEQVVNALKARPEVLENLIAVGHRVVHGGELFKASTLIDDKVIAGITSCNRLAPLHNPANLLGIQSSMIALPHLPQVAVFDTAFHQSIPEYAFLYPLPYETYRMHGVRRYGFHGSSHVYVCQQAADYLKRDIQDSCFISAHLGNGCSISAVKNGESIDTSMGMTPLEGLVMGTRCGDIDPSLHQYLAGQMSMTLEEVTNMLNKRSGLLGISEKTNDMRELTELAKDGDKRAQLAIEVFCYRLAKYIGSYAIPLGRIDALIFTGGIGENAAIIRKEVSKWLNILNIKLDEDANDSAKGDVTLISKEDAVPILVIKTNEEWVIAKDAAQFA